MTKQKKGGRSTDRDQGPERKPGPAPELDPLVVEQGVLGNQAVQAQMAGDAAEAPAVSLDIVRDVAVPFVERALLGLELGPIDAARHARFTDILEASHLPSDRQQILLDKLETDLAASTAIDEAVERWFGGDTSRSDVSRALDAVWAGLAAGRAEQGAWRVGDQEVAVSDGTRDGSVAKRAESLVGDVAEAVVPSGPVRQGATTDVGAALRGLCRDIVLLLAFEEEEEEEDAPGWEMGLEEA